MLTGQLGQNNGAHHNNRPRAYSALEDNNTIATWFDEAGYAASMAGKFIKGWEPDDWPRPAGWDRMSVLLDQTAYDPFELVF